MAAGILSASIAATPAHAIEPIDDGRYSNIPFGEIAKTVVVQGVKENVKENAFTYGTTVGISCAFAQKRQEML